MAFRLISFTVILLPGWYTLCKYWFLSPLIIRNMEYGKGAKNRNLLDIYLPVPHNPSSGENDRYKSKSGTPVVVFVSGGAWMIGYKMWSALVARGLARLGILTIVPDYRNFPQGDIDDMVEDIRLALQWTVCNAHRFGGDAEKIVLSGQSAGAHICLCLLVSDFLQTKQRQHQKEQRHQEVLQMRLQKKFLNEHGAKACDACSDTLISNVINATNKSDSNISIEQQLCKAALETRIGKQMMFIPGASGNKDADSSTVSKNNSNGSFVHLEFQSSGDLKQQQHQHLLMSRSLPTTPIGKLTAITTTSSLLSNNVNAVQHSATSVKLNKKDSSGSNDGIFYDVEGHNVWGHSATVPAIATTTSPSVGEVQQIIVGCESVLPAASLTDNCTIAVAEESHSDTTDNVVAVTQSQTTRPSPIKSHTSSSGHTSSNSVHLSNNCVAEHSNSKSATNNNSSSSLESSPMKSSNNSEDATGGNSDHTSGSDVDVGVLGRIIHSCVETVSNTRRNSISAATNNSAAAIKKELHNPLTNQIDSDDGSVNDDDGSCGDDTDDDGDSNYEEEEEEEAHGDANIWKEVDTDSTDPYNSDYEYQQHHHHQHGQSSDGRRRRRRSHSSMSSSGIARNRSSSSASAAAIRRRHSHICNKHHFNASKHVKMFIGVSGPYNLQALESHLHARGLDSSIAKWIFRGDLVRYSPTLQLQEYAEKEVQRLQDKLLGATYTTTPLASAAVVTTTTTTTAAATSAVNSEYVVVATPTAITHHNHQHHEINSSNGISNRDTTTINTVNEEETAPSLDKNNVSSSIISRNNSLATSNVLKDLTPILLLHGSRDASVPVSLCTELAEVLHRHGAETLCSVYEGWSHTDSILEAPLSGRMRLFNDMSTAIYHRFSNNSNNNNAATNTTAVTLPVIASHNDVANNSNINSFGLPNSGRKPSLDSGSLFEGSSDSSNSSSGSIVSVLMEYSPMLQMPFHRFYPRTSNGSSSSSNMLCNNNSATNESSMTVESNTTTISTDISSLATTVPENGNNTAATLPSTVLIPASFPVKSRRSSKKGKSSAYTKAVAAAAAAKLAEEEEAKRRRTDKPMVSRFLVKIAREINPF